MKTTFKKNIFSMTVGASLAVLLSQSVIARPSHQGGHHRGHGQPSVEAVLNRMDFDKDGNVTVEDFLSRSANHADKHFVRMDKDENELISLEEFISKRQTRRHGGLSEDIDHDALKLCVEETTGLTLKDRLGPEEVFSLIDANEDETLTVDEFISDKSAHAVERFGELDVDEDGVISEDEVTTQIAERKALHEARRSCIDEQSIMDL